MLVWIIYIFIIPGSKTITWPSGNSPRYTRPKDPSPIRFSCAKLFVAACKSATEYASAGTRTLTLLVGGGLLGGGLIGPFSPSILKDGGAFRASDFRGGDSFLCSRGLVLPPAPLNTPAVSTFCTFRGCPGSSLSFPISPCSNPHLE